MNRPKFHLNTAHRRHSNVIYILLGDERCGKTSILNRYVHQSFTEIYTQTLTPHITRQTISLSRDTMNILVWDTPGQEQHRTFLVPYTRKATVALIVYDVTSRDSFNSVDEWIEDVRQLGKDKKIVLIGNKVDLADQREVSTQEGWAKARQLAVEFVETSAKTGFNISTDVLGKSWRRRNRRPFLNKAMRKLRMLLKLRV